MLLIIPAALLLFIIADLLASKYALKVTSYEITSDKIESEIRIVELADLHGSSFGRDNVRLAKKVAAQEPDLILIAGDLLDSGEEDSLETAQSLIAQLCAIAPVYISPGNHELEYEELYGVDVAAVFEAAGGSDAGGGSAAEKEETAGSVSFSAENSENSAADGEEETSSGGSVEIENAEENSEKVETAAEDSEEAVLYPCTVLDMEYVDIEVKGQAIRIGGIYGYCLPEEFLETGEANAEECAFLTEMQDTDAYTILLCHMPVCWTANGGLESWEISCVLTGHAHGGQAIIPGIGGLWAPDQGWFPGVLTGLVTSKDGEKTLVYSAGLGNTEWLPRFNNIPEIVTIRLD